VVETKTGETFFEDGASQSEIDQIGLGVDPAIAAQVELGVALRRSQAIFDGLDVNAQAPDVAGGMNERKAGSDSQAKRRGVAERSEVRAS